MSDDPQSPAYVPSLFGPRRCISDNVTARQQQKRHEAAKRREQRGEEAESHTVPCSMEADEQSTSPTPTRYAKFTAFEEEYFEALLPQATVLMKTYEHPLVVSIW